MKSLTFLSLIGYFIIICACQQKTGLLEIDGTKAMVDSIDAIYRRTDFLNHPYEYGEKIKIVKEKVFKASEENRVTEDLFRLYAISLLNAGEIEAATLAFEELTNKISENIDVNDRSKHLHEAWAISNLRFGELNNCILNHNEESCIFPIQGKGIHQDKSGSTMAIQILTEILKKYPDDLQSKWLLNIAYMTLGEYPEKVPSEWMIPDQPPNSEPNFPIFPNIAQGLSLDINELAGGVVLDDFNNDGYMDIMVSSWGMKNQLRYFVNSGNGEFIEKTDAAGLTGLTGGLNLKQTDYNNDGFLDLYVTRGAWKPFRKYGILPNSLLKNNGDGTFTDVTIQSGLYSQEPSQTAIWADFNLDGWLDLFVGNESVDPNEPHPCEFFINDKKGRFKNLSQELGLNIRSYIKGAVAGDINNDGWPDLYISSLTSKNFLFINQGTKSGRLSFVESAVSAGVDEPLQSFPCWFFDYNNDGNEDLFVAAFDQFAFSNQSAEIAASYLGIPYQGDVPRLFQNKGNGTFQNVAKNMGLAVPVHPMGCNFSDINNDGFLDFYLGTGAPDFRAIVPNRMFINDKGIRFKDVTNVGRFGNIQKGHGISFADMDNDGDQDIYAVMGGSYTGDNFQNSLYQNPGFSNNWVTLKLIGTKSNKAAIGARVCLTLNSEGKQNWKIYRTVDSGASFGANSLQLEIGVGDAYEITDVQVNWPNKKNEFISYGTMPLNKKWVILENEPKAIIAEYNKIEFKLKGSEHTHDH